MKDWNVVEVLQHSRHDWLNKLQLIKGNLALDRIERAKEIIEEIVIEAQNEAKLTNLQLRDLAGFLMTYNWECHHFILEFEVLGDPINLSHYDVHIKNWCEQFFTILDESVMKIGDNHLSISIDPIGTEVRFFFDFNGTITDTRKVKEWLQSQDWIEMIKLSDLHVNENELSIEIRIGS
ncbi:Spo0B C-terminal domain-containing protein [Bacillus sp. DJP31]|uniref:Spo0B C-terminal domain-containing protein n=1 Tax=Bacillus sp. DJP31 TaxID=3409789 RepID=UPI003BB794F9